MLCTGDMYLSSLFVCRRPSCQTTPHGVWDALRYVQVLFQFCAWQGHLDSVPGAVEDPGMIYLTHHGVIEIPLVRLLPINSNVRCFAHYTFSLLFSMDTPIPHFLFLDLYSYSLYPFIIFSLFFFSFVAHFLYVLATMPLLKQHLYLARASLSFLIFLSTARALLPLARGTYKLCCVQCIIIILVLHDSSCLWVGD